VTSKRQSVQNSDPDPHLEHRALDEFFEVLQRTERRELLVALDRNASGQLKLNSRKMTYNSWIALLHSHLPKLEEQELVDWDADTRVVERGRRFDEIRYILELLPGGTA
jgi:hypothetical protein